MPINDDLFEKCKQGDLESVKLLISQGADVNAEDRSWGDTPLIVAIQKSHEAIVKFLIEQGANVNFKKKKNGETPLIIACEKGSPDIVNLLITSGVDVNVEGGLWGDTPLIIAIQKGHETVAKLLVEHGANINFKKEKTGQTPLMYACEQGSLEIANLLINKGADINARTTSDTLLVLASAQGHIDIVKLLLSKGVNLNEKDNEGKTEFSRVCSIFFGRNHPDLKKRLSEIVAYLISQGANINTLDQDGNSPLMGAIDNFNEDVFTCLIEHGANVAIKNKKGDTPLSMLKTKPELSHLIKILESRGVSKSSIYDKDSAYDGWIVWMEVTHTSSPELDLALKEANDRKSEVITSGTIWAIYNNERSARYIGELLKKAGVRDPAVSKVRCYKYPNDPRINKANSRIMENGWTIEHHSSQLDAASKAVPSEKPWWKFWK